MPNEVCTCVFEGLQCTPAAATLYNCCVLVAWKVALERGIAHAEWSVYRMPPPDQPHGRVSFLEGRPGVLAVLGALHHQSGNAAAALTACEVSTEGNRGLLDSC